MSTPPSLATGDQYTLVADGTLGRVTATVAQLAAGLRRLTVGGVELVQDYPENALPSSASGTVLVPWPNRTAGAVWLLDGVPQQLDITDPSRGNAIHGLLRNTGYRVTDRTDSAITLSASVFPQHGYPFRLDTAVTYSVGDDGLTVTHDIRNVGSRPAPAGIGAHPFLRVGDAPTASLTVTVAADRYFAVDARLNPTGRHPVDGTDLDLRTGRALRGVTIDTAYSDIATVDDRVRHRLSAPSGESTELWGDADFAFAQVFTTDVYATDDGPIEAVAIEPMTCAPNALNSGLGLHWLESGDQWVTSWGIRRIPA